MTQLFGDIGGFSKSVNILGLKDITYRHARININPSLKYRVTKDITARVGITMGYFHSIDKRGSNIKRDFESATVFIEPAILGEYHFLLSPGNQRSSVKRHRQLSAPSIFSRIDLYVFTGVCGISYTVFPNDHLEPFVRKKIGFAATIPLGVGTNLIYSRYFNLGIELSGRYAFTDNLDGYTSQYSKSNDLYYLLNMTITYKIKTGKHGLPFF